MFNKVYAPFAGTIDRGAGARQRRRRPQGPAAVPGDARRELVEEDPAERERRVRATTEAYLARLGEP